MTASPPDNLRHRLQTTLGSAYTLERELGGGGMSRVFLAEDVALGRRVVVKVLAPELAEGLSADRFTREIRLAARLQHPNIVPVLGAGAGSDALPYYTMPFIAGASLRERFAMGPLPIPEAVSILRDIARALACAHAEGVVHRDIKPENVLLTGGAAVVTDFGIAKALSVAGAGAAPGGTLTQVGMAIGTPAYMAPEQAVGEEINHRADLYAWGLLAWEALAGRHPFAGRTSGFALIGAQLNEVPAPLASVRDDVPPALAVLIARCVAKDPAERPTDVAEVLGSLESAALAPGAAQVTQQQEPAPSVAVLPFANMSADPDAEYFSDGITEEILNALAKLSGLRVMARTSSFAFKGRNLDVREIGRQLGARYVLEGSVRRGGTRLRITAQLIDASQGHHLWSERYDRDMSDVFAVQDEITAAIRDALASRLLGIGQAPSHVTPAIDAATYELFLRGRHLIRHRTGDVEGGMAILTEVIRRAPDFAPAYVALAIAWTVRIFYGYVVPRDGWPRVRELGERAASIDPLHASAYYLLAEAAFYWEWNWARAEQLYRRALELDANDVETAPSYGMYLASVRRFDESLRLCAHARAQDPLNPSVLLRLMICQCMARRFDELLSTCDRAIALFPELPESYRWKGLALLAMGRAADAVAPLESAVQLSGRNAWAVFDLGQALVTLGQITEAHSLGAELRVRAASEPVPAWALTLEPQTAVGGPNLDGVFTGMETYCEQRGFWMVMLAVEPLVDWLREDPRFNTLVARVGIPATA